MSIQLATARRAHARPHCLLPIGFGALTLSLSCTSPAREPLDPSALAVSLSLRDCTAEELEQALALLPLDALPLPRPDAEALGDPAASDYWRARAWVYAPVVRQARRALSAARARLGSAGAPEPIELGFELEDLGGPHEQAQVALTFDLLGIFGLGRSAAAKELAQAETRRLQAELERALWLSAIEVERARARAAAAAERVAALDALAQQAREDRARIEILAARGYPTEDAVQWAWAMLQEVELRAAEGRAAEAEARAALARTAGLPPESALLEAPQWPASPAPLSKSGPDRWSAREGLFHTHPRLRPLALDYAIAESRLRAAAAERLPELRAGPQPVFVSDEILHGGVLAFGLAWPGKIAREMRAAIEEREAARERVEDELLSLWTEIESREVGLRVAEQNLRERAGSIDAASAAMWRAARARFANDTGALPDWSFALEHRVEPMLAHIDAREALLLAALDYEEARGPAAPAEPRVALALGGRP